MSQEDLECDIVMMFDISANIYIFLLILRQVAHYLCQSICQNIPNPNSLLWDEPDLRLYFLLQRLKGFTINVTVKGH